MKKVYIKNNHEIASSPKFVYCSTIYRIMENGAGMVSEKYYVSKSPINFKKLKFKRKGFKRYINLESAPEDYLITQGYKLKNL